MNARNSYAIISSSLFVWESVTSLAHLFNEGDDAVVTIVLAVVTGVAVGGPDMVWLDAVDWRGKGIELPASGAYGVWVFAPVNESVEVFLDGLPIRTEKPGDDKGGFGWRKLGSFDLPKGRIASNLGANVATIVLTTDTTFDPAKSTNDMRVFDRLDLARDMRARTFRDTDSVAVFPHYETLEAWRTQAAQLRRRMLIGSGLFPLPEKTPLNAKVFGEVKHEDYSVFKVSFEARPGFLVTGNLYRPVGDGPFPAIINPHGHWPDGRNENGDRASVPARCITFARMGIVAFNYDMLGYQDSKQLSHGFGGDVEKLWGLHPFALQLWSSVRAVDFVQSLPYVDPEKVGCTGASGGGTQTFALNTIDDRVKVSAPVNMISCSMQGGCICENAPIIRLDGVSNMHFGAMAAPRPLLMVAATGDWTVETPRVEYPAVKSIYELFGAADRVESVQFNFDHNYNKSSREAVYRFFGKWLLGQGEKYATFTEPPYEMEPLAALRVFPDDEKPQGYPSADEIVKQTIASTEAKWQAILPKDAASGEAFRKDYGVALADTLGTSLPGPNDFSPYRPRRGEVEKRDGYVLERWVIRRTAVEDAIPAVIYRPDDAVPRDAVVVVHEQGKGALADPKTGGPGELVLALVKAGKCVAVIDPFLTGEHHGPLARTERIVGRFPDTFMPTDTGYRVQDILTAAAFLRARRDVSGKVDLVGLGDAGLWCLFAGALDDHVGRVVVDANRFDNGNDREWVHRFYVPCIRSIGDVVTAAAMISPRPLYVANTGDAFKTDSMARVYQAVGASPLRVSRDPLSVDQIVAALTSA